MNYDFIMEMIYQDVFEVGNTDKGRALIKKSADRNGEVISKQVGKTLGLYGLTKLHPDKKKEYGEKAKDIINDIRISKCSKNLLNGSKRLGTEPEDHLSKITMTKSAIEYGGIKAFGTLRGEIKNKLAKYKSQK